MPSLTLQQQYDTDLPKSAPLDSIAQLKQWNASTQDVFNVASVPLRTRPKHSTPNLMLCHDMAGGYKEDFAIQGNNYSTIYNSQYWQYVDTFIYFSHNRVTIPPVNWINACHRNGVSCLGTFIVEGDSGTPELDAFLEGPPELYEDYETDPTRIWSPYYADKLVEIAKFYGFDGWLINIESEFPSFPTAPQLKAQQLTDLIAYLTTRMHKEIPGSSVIWYDSMTIQGEIDYQNNLTKLNDPFFKAADGIFLNYWWTDDYPKESAQLAKSLGRSPKDVYFGTDVWGRGTYGGGQFNSYKGVEASDKGDTSSVLFAMAYTYEHFDKKNFNLYDRLLWMGGDPSEYPPEDPPAEKNEKQEPVSLKHIDTTRHKGIADFDKLRDIPNDWFVSWFDRGYGSAFYFHGERLLLQPWSQLSHQGILPNLDYRKPVDAGNVILHSALSDKDPYMSGTSLWLKSTAGKAAVSKKDVSVPLYQMTFDIRDGLAMKFVYKLTTQVSQIGIYCHLALSPDMVDAWKNAMPHIPLQKSSTGLGVYEIYVGLDGSKNGNDSWVVKDIQTPPLQGSPARRLSSIAVIKEVGWSVRVDPKEEGTSLANLGYISVIPSASVAPLAPTALNLHWQSKEYHAVQGSPDKTLWATLSWTSIIVDGSSKNLAWSETDFFIVSLSDANHTTKVFLGTAFCDKYRISGLGASQMPYVKVEAVDRLGHIKAEGIIALN
ncbi:hypothetical protein DFQ28_002995 [Apophysomyces sp. BC1034]|nr:hypothetical protein DFQ30_006440 [Apophysomyces sp. BC1015]KAG0177268.1 hypothetical protein DFQ29_005045 [Apophysomyces sp. BC1021]KAG0193843.1 hypothetical protein DFQ28_002995 [Apophysomyces sp. BC1034]